MSFTANLLWFLIIKQCGIVGKKKFLPNRVLTNYKEKKNAGACMDAHTYESGWLVQPSLPKGVAKGGHAHLNI